MMKVAILADGLGSRLSEVISVYVNLVQLLF
jgi:hypothetical protein